MRTRRFKLSSRSHRVLIGTVAAGLAISSQMALGITTAQASTSHGSHLKGVATFAESPGSPPNYIFPIDPLQYYTTTNIAQFQYLMFRPLYWFGKGSSVVLNEPLSLAYAPVYSNGNTTVTIKLKSYKWSDGAPVTSRDVIFWMNLLEANKSNFGEYVPGYFPDDVKSTVAEGPSTIVMKLTAPVSPTWFTFNELSQISPLPQHAWDKTSTSSPIGNYDTTTSGATAVYNYLAGQSQNLHTYASNPLWQVVDGPWKLSNFQTNGYAAFVPNTNYSGPIKPKLAKFIEEPFSTESSEFNLLRSGSLSYGYIPFTDLPQAQQIKSEGYNEAPWLLWSMNMFPMNYNNPTVGPLFHQQYIRAALQSLIDEPKYVSTFLKGYGAPDYGPVPTTPKTPYLASTLSSAVYPYNLAKTTASLKAHGWHIAPGTTDTCVRPGTGSNECGADVKKGQQLSFTLAFPSGITYLQQEFEAYKSAAAQTGITISLSEHPQSFIFSITAPCTSNQAACSWEMSYPGGWEFSPDNYPSGEVAFSTGAIGNYGSYTSKTMDSLVNATTTKAGLGTFYTWERYTAKVLPTLFLPLADQQISAIKSTLHGTTPQPIDGLALTPEDWYYS